MKRKHQQKILLSTLTALSVYGTFAGSTEPALEFFRGTAIESILVFFHIGNSIVFNISVGILISLVFWWLLVDLPQRNKRHILRTNLSNSYKQFKIAIIEQFLFASNGTYTVGEEGELLDHLKFREYFNKDKKAKWYAVLNNLEHDESKVNFILIELEIFRNEVAHVLNNVEIDEQVTHALFRSLNSHIYKLRHSATYTDQQVTHLCGFLWDILARWNVVTGYNDEDIVQQLIDSI